MGIGPTFPKFKILEVHHYIYRPQDWLAKFIADDFLSFIFKLGKDFTFFDGACVAYFCDVTLDLLNIYILSDWQFKHYISKLIVKTELQHRMQFYPQEHIKQSL